MSMSHHQSLQSVWKKKNKLLSDIWLAIRNNRIDLFIYLLQESIIENSNLMQLNLILYVYGLQFLQTMIDNMILFSRCRARKIFNQNVSKIILKSLKCQARYLTSTISHNRFRYSNIVGHLWSGFFIKLYLHINCLLIIACDMAKIVSNAAEKWDFIYLKSFWPFSGIPNQYRA